MIMPTTKKLVRAVFEYDDGTIHYLDDDADRWSNEVMGLYALARLNNLAHKRFNWKSHKTDFDY